MYNRYLVTGKIIFFFYFIQELKKSKIQEQLLSKKSNNIHLDGKINPLTSLISQNYPQKTVWIIFTSQNAAIEMSHGHDNFTLFFRR